MFVRDLDSGTKVSKGGIILTDDDMTERGIRERWAQVWAVGPEVEDVQPGDWVLVKHGRWTNSMDFSLPEGEVRVWRIDYPEAVLLVSKDDPRENRAFAY